LDEGTKGIFGIGGKQARVRVSLRENAGQIAASFLSEVLDLMNTRGDIEVEEDDESITLVIKGDDGGIIIGRRGETLDALQYITSLVVNKNREQYKRVTVDIEGYRKKREETLIKLATRLAERVVTYKKPVSLEPMNPYERRIIHFSLQDNKLVKTFSTGEEPNRKVVIALK
jgi:spoIIIJ-associated protein